MIKFKIKLLTSYGNICGKQTWDFYIRNQTSVLLLILWVLICMCLVYIKQPENPRGGRSPRPDDTCLGLLQGIKCEIAEALMRTCDISWKISSCSWQLTKHQCGIYHQNGAARSWKSGDGQAALLLQGDWMRILDSLVQCLAGRKSRVKLPFHLKGGILHLLDFVRMKLHRCVITHEWGIRTVYCSRLELLSSSEDFFFE